MGQRYNAETASRGVPGWKPRADRTCRECGNVMRPTIQWRPATPADEGRESRIAGYPFRKEVAEAVKYYGYGPDGHFCSLRCGYRWACRAICD